MNILICGGGQVGFSIARYLSTHDNDVTVIDQSEEVIHHISTTLDVRGILGQASHPDVLAHANSKEIEMIVAVTGLDEVNIVACQIAHSLFNVPIKIARVRSKSYLESGWGELYRQQQMPIDLVLSPELEVARAISKGLDVPGAFEVISFSHDALQLVGIRCPEKAPILNTPLRLLETLFPHLELTIMCVLREGIHFIPQHTEQLKPDDEVYFLTPQKHLLEAAKVFGFTEKGSQRTLILGGGNVGIALAEEIEANYSQIVSVLIENDPQRAIQAANHLARTLVLKGDGLDADILREANVKTVDKFVAVTSDDKVNILSCLLAKRLGAVQALALVNSSSYMALTPTLDIDSTISPKALTVSSILQYVRRGRVCAVHSLRDNVGEVIEAEAVGTSGVLGMKVSDINVPDSLLVGAIIRDDKILMPRDDLVIRVHDRVVMMVMHTGIKYFEKLFSIRLGYF